VRTVGVDLAAEPTTTAIAVIDWQAGGAQVAALRVPADDDAVLLHTEGAEKVGIDCPLGWPDSFVDFVQAHRDGPTETRAGPEWRRSLAYRRTDEHVRSVLPGLIPLSVATDRIGLTAMRAARLQALLAERGHSVDRTGTGLIVEVYPAAGLRKWELAHRGYKGAKNVTTLDDLVGSLTRSAPWLDLGEFEPLCRRSDHAFDAVIAALLARAAALGLSTPPDDPGSAATEGWIALPTCPLDDLITPSEGRMIGR
jgi:predicted nuclease with RNAse H fold